MSRYSLAPPRQSLLAKAYGAIVGGWRTWGPGSGVGLGAFAASSAGLSKVSPSGALNLSAWFAATRLRAETVGTLPFKLIEKRTNKEVTDHSLYELFANKPNAHQTGAEFWSAMVNNFDVCGNAVAILSRYSNGEIYNAQFIPTELMTATLDKLGRPTFVYEGEVLNPDNVLHVPNFSMNGYWGIPTLVAAQLALGMQQASNSAAASTFNSGLKAGGWFIPDEKKGQMTPEQVSDFYSATAEMYKPENIGKYFLMPRGITVQESAAGTRIDPVSAELLQSRYFGIEEICRFLAVPPPLIGHTDKASSWASSIDALNQHLVTYGLMPVLIRNEKRIKHTCMTPRERNRFDVRFNVEGLLRGDIEKRFKTYEIGRKYNIYSPNDVRRKEGMTDRDDPKGNEYTVESNVQVN